jgi:hypothetical protein
MNASNTPGYWTKFWANVAAWWKGQPLPYPNVPIGGVLWFLRGA